METKKQIKTNWQITVLVTVAVIGVMLSASLSAFAQAKYKVGDKVEVMQNGEWVKAEVRKVEGNGQVYVRFDGSSSDAMTYLDYIRPVNAATQPNNQTANQTTGNIPTANQPAPPEPAAKGNKYGTHDARTCKDMKAPARGGITAALAEKYLICEREKVSGQYLYLIENVKVQVGGSRPYSVNKDLNVPNINVRFPLYSIRGSLTSYQCTAVNANFNFSAPGKNCIRREEPQAMGFCYKTTFGEWRCEMRDNSYKNENYFPNVAPPKP